MHILSTALSIHDLLQRRIYKCFFLFFFNFKNTLHFWYSTHFSLIHHLEIVSSSCFEQFSVLHEYLPMFLITHPSRLLIPIPRTPVESSEFHRFHGFNTVFEIFRGVLPFPPTWKNQLFVLSRVFFFVFLLFFCDDTCKKYIYMYKKRHSTLLILIQPEFLSFSGF